jgi:hypothetical protein
MSERIVIECVDGFLGYRVEGGPPASIGLEYGEPTLPCPHCKVCDHEVATGRGSITPCGKPGCNVVAMFPDQLVFMWKVWSSCEPTRTLTPSQRAAERARPSFRNRPDELAIEAMPGDRTR